MFLNRYVFCLLLISGNIFAMHNIIDDLRGEIGNFNAERVDQILKENPNLDLPNDIVTNLWGTGQDVEILDAIIGYAKRRNPNGHLPIINHVDANDNTLLLVGVYAGYADMVEILLKNGANTQKQYQYFPEGLLAIALDNLERAHVRRYPGHLLDQNDVIRIIALLQQYAPQLVNAQKPTVQRQLAQRFYWGREVVPGRLPLPDAFKSLTTTEQSPLPGQHMTKMIYVRVGLACLCVLVCIGVYRYLYTQEAEEEEDTDDDDTSQNQDENQSAITAKNL